MILAHKYKMHHMLAELESALIAKVIRLEQPGRQSLRQLQQTMPDDVAFVVRTLAAAEACDQHWLCSHCERYLIRNICRIDCLEDSLVGKLSAPSMVRIARGLHFCHKQNLDKQWKEAEIVMKYLQWAGPWLMLVVQDVELK